MNILPEKRNCLNCKSEFETTRSTAKYCSSYCKDTFSRKNNPESARQRQRRSYIKHKETRLLENKKWREEHPTYNRDRYKQDVNLRLYHYKDRSGKRGIEWSLSDEEAIKLMISDCYYCGEKGIGIDRVNSHKGYTIENSVPCCSMCNTMKMDTDLELFINKIHKISERWKTD